MPFIIHRNRLESHIAAKVDAAWKDLNKNISSKGCLCLLKTLTYERGQSPVYSEPFVQQYYMLRYYPAYLAEYLLAYKFLLSQNFLGQPTRVLSFGCGCGTDLTGLCLAQDAIDPSVTPSIEYTGIDAIDWGYREKQPQATVQFVIKDLQTMSTLPEGMHNVLVFPKSLGEFSDTVFSHIIDLCKQFTFVSENICIVTSVMTEENSQAQDGQRALRLVDTFEKALGYKCLDDAHKYTYFKPVGKEGIANICPGFAYPDAVLDKLKNLLDLCPKRKANHGKECTTKCSNLNHWPILTAKYMKFQVLRLQKIVS